MNEQQTTGSYYINTGELGTITQPYTISWGNPIPNIPSRQEELQELETLVRLMNMTDHECIEERLHDAVHLKLDELYPELIGVNSEEEVISDKMEELLTKWNARMKDEPLDDKTAEKATSTTHYHNYYNVMDLISKGACTSISRKNWDNTINQEYVTWIFNVGLVKNYKTASLDGYFKNVQHTYRPTEEDKEAIDWYII